VHINTHNHHYPNHTSAKHLPATATTARTLDCNIIRIFNITPKTYSSNPFREKERVPKGSGPLFFPSDFFFCWCSHYIKENSTHLPNLFTVPASVVWFIVFSVSKTD
jgi:hypothetical protein